MGTEIPVADYKRKIVHLPELWEIGKSMEEEMDKGVPWEGELDKAIPWPEEIDSSLPWEDE
jgi:hypothetical protein